MSWTFTQNSKELDNHSGTWKCLRRLSNWKLTKGTCRVTCLRLWKIAKNGDGLTENNGTDEEADGDGGECGKALKIKERK